jgi:YidC/Oxa1 family membrane protein insertase
METRTLLYIALAVVMVLMFEAWQTDYGQSPQQAASSQAQTTGNGDTATVAPADSPADIQPDMASAPGNAVELPGKTVLKSSERISVETDVYHIEIDLAGGDLRVVDLKTYPASAHSKDIPYRLMNDRMPDLFVSQSGLLSKQAAPNHHAVYTSAKQQYSMGDNEDSLRVPLTWQQNGIAVTKTYVFHRGDFVIDLSYEVLNQSGSEWSGRLYRQFQRNEPERENRFLYTYTGGAISSPDKPYEKIKFDDMQDSNLSVDITGGWAAMIQHYFLGAWLNTADELNRFYTKVVDGDRYVLGMVGVPQTVATGSKASFASRMFVGPKIQSHLEEVAPHLELTVDYGWLTFLAKPLFWIMDQINRLLGNWGFTIIAITILIKLVFYRLSESSYRSMAKMKKLAPRLKQMKERYGDDRQKMNQAMMDLYKTEKINPLGGCFPILIQIPVFIALYWVLLESVELRQAPFIFWLDDLSSPDPYYVLPILMGATMLLQQKLNPAPIDPMQAKIMMILPVVFTVFFLFFPQGLVLYWVVNNSLSILQQWVINKRIGATS